MKFGKRHLTTPRAKDSVSVSLKVMEQGKRVCKTTGFQSLPIHSRVSVIFDDLSPTHGRLPIAPQIDVPKDLSSEMSLEVA